MSSHDRRPPLRALALALSLTACASKTPPPPPAPAEPAPTNAEPADAPDPALLERMERLAKRVDRKREELGIPGLALVVVQGDHVLLSRGFGLRDVEAAAPVDEDTLFAIGSTTKAFTATLMMMAVDEGLISLDDPPRTCVPYLKLKDPEADKKLTVRDLLIHSSGLMRTDLGWYTGALSTEEVIRLAGDAEPTAKLGERFQYQNVMYAAAGACLETLYKTTYPELLQQKIFAPLGMTHGTNVSVAANLGRPERAVGYAKVGPDKALAHVPMRPIDNVAAAGAINSSLRDITPWLQFNLDAGEFGGTRLLSKAGFKQLGKKHQKIGGAAHYGLGWIRDRWRTHRRLSHTGGIDGFVTLISMLPKEDIAFALFTNIQNGDIHGYVTEEVYGALLDESWGAKSDDAGAPALPPGGADEVGRYGVVGGLTVEVALDDAKQRLQLRVPQQPTYELIHQKDRRYRLGPPAPSGFYVEFRPLAGATDKTEIVLEQPQGTLKLAELHDSDFAAARDATIPKALRELVGVYGVTVQGKENELQVGLSEGRVALLVPGQSPAPLVPKPKGGFSLDGLPANFSVERVPAKGALKGLKVVQPGITLDLTLKAKRPLPKLSVAQILKKMRRAAGSKALAKHTSKTVTMTQRYVNQGLTGTHVTHTARDNRLHDVTTLRAFDRDLGTTVSSYDGKSARQTSSFSKELPLTTEQVNAIRISALFDPLLDHPELFDAPVITRAGSIGDEPTVVLTIGIKTGGSVLAHVSTKRWLVLKQVVSLPLTADGQELTTSVRLEDYRAVKGVTIAHTVTSQGIWGEVVETVDSVVFDQPMPAG